jgi:hypothetical protein
VAFTLLHPVMALAQVDISGADQSAIFAQLGTGWFTTLQGMAARLYGALFTLEVIVVCVQGALYKDNVAEFFQGFAFKILTATVMLAVIGNAGVIFPAIVGMFQTTAAQVTGLTTHSTNVCFQNTSNAACTAQTIANPIDLETHMLLWSLQYFIAADASRAADSAESAIAGIVVFGTGVPGLSTAFLMGHENFSLFCIAMGMTCVMSAAGILLTYVLLTFETQIVMMIGVIYLAFQGSRYTAQFSQGYMSYCINIGTKFFVFYFMVSILGQMLDAGDSSLGASIASLVAGAVIPFGAGSIVLVAASSPIPVICVITSILVAAIPNFASSLLSGGSALSAGSALQNSAIQSGLSGAAGGVSQLGSAATSGAKQAMSGGGKGGGGNGAGAGMPDRSGAGDVGSAAPGGNTTGLGSEYGSGGGSEEPGAPGSNGAPTGGALGSDGNLLSGGFQGGGQGATNGAMAGAAGVGAAAADADLAEDAIGADDSQWVNGAGDDGGVGAGAPQLGDSISTDGVDADGDDAGEGADDVQDERDEDQAEADDQVQAQRDQDLQAQQAHQDDAAQQKADAPKSLDGYTPDQLRSMDASKVEALAKHTDLQSMSKDQIKAIQSDPKLSDAAAQGFKSQAVDKALSTPSAANPTTGSDGKKEPSEYQKAAAAAAASAAGTPPPAAVTVRVTNPDKL